MQETNYARPRLTTAYTRLAAAQVALERGRWEALVGTAYDPDAYDALILEWRAARRNVAAAAATWDRLQPLPNGQRAAAGA